MLCSIFFSVIFFSVLFCLVSITMSSYSPIFSSTTSNSLLLPSSKFFITIIVFYTSRSSILIFKNFYMSLLNIFNLLFQYMEYSHNNCFNDFANSLIFVIYGSLYIAFSSFSLEFLDWFLASMNFMLLDIFVFQYS